MARKRRWKAEGDSLLLPPSWTFVTLSILFLFFAARATTSVEGKKRKRKDVKNVHSRGWVGADSPRKWAVGTHLICHLFRDPWP